MARKGKYIPCDVERMITIDKTLFTDELLTWFEKRVPIYRDQVLKEHLFEATADSYEEEDLQELSLTAQQQLTKLFNTANKHNAAYVRIRWGR